MKRNEMTTVRVTRLARKLARLEARVTSAQKRLIEQAAGISGKSVTEFVVSSAQEAANATIRDSEVLRLLRDESRDVFVEALLRPPRPNRALRAAFKRYRRTSGR